MWLALDITRLTFLFLTQLPWPRTTTEQLLMEMFDGTASQFLAILEALSDSSRRVLHPTPPVPDEPEIRDVISELFFAGLEILSGNSIKNQESVGEEHRPPFS